MKKVNKKFSKLKRQKKLENFDFNKNLNGKDICDYRKEVKGNKK